MPTPALLRALPLLLLAACARDYVPAGMPSGEESIIRATETLANSADLLQVVDGATLLLPEAYYYETRIERTLRYEPDGFVVPESRPVRVLKGPRRVHVPLRLVRAVSARTGPLTANVEIELDVPVPGVPGPRSNTLLILAEDPERARQLVDALDLALRANRSP